MYLRPLELENQKFLLWAREKNTVINGLKLVAKSPSNRCFIATRNIKPSSCILEVPENIILFLDSAMGTEIGTEIEKNISKVNCGSKGHLIMAVFLLIESEKTDSFWEPYLNILRRSSCQTVLSKSSSCFNILSMTDTLRKHQYQRKRIINLFEQLKNKVKSLKRISFESFLWAYCISISRTYGIDVDGVHRSALIPVADFFNHDFNPSLKWYYDSAKKSFCMDSLKPIFEGQEVTISYGTKCNSRFFVNYSFALETNLENKVSLDLYSLLWNQPEFINKKKMVLEFFKKHLKLPKMCPTNFLLSMHPTDPATGKAFVFLRLCHSRKSTISAMEKTLRKTSSVSEAEKVILSFGTISKENELLCLQKLSVLAKSRLALFETSFNEDMQSIEKIKNKLESVSCWDAGRSRLELELSERFILKGEKEVLRFYGSLYERALPFLKNGWEYFEREAEKFRFCLKDPFKSYVWKCVGPLVCTENWDEYVKSAETEKDEIIID